MAILQSDILFGKLASEKAKLEESQDIFAIASLYPEYTQVMVRKSSNIENVIQLAGKKVFVGKPGSGTEVNARIVLESAGIKANDYTPVDPNEYNNARVMEEICNGKIDAGFRVTGTIIPKINKCLTLVDLDPQLHAAITNKYPFYGLTEIEIDGKSFSTLFTRAVLAVSGKIEKSLTAAEITALTEAIVNDLPARFQKELPASQNAMLFKGSKVVAALPIEFHPAAQLYYEENGFLKSNVWKWWITFALLWGTIAAIKMHSGSRTPLEELIYSKNSKWVSFLYEIGPGLVHWIITVMGQTLAALGRSIRDFSFFQSPITVTVYGLVVFLWVAMLTILHFEGTYALTRDIPNEFENIDLSDFSIWLLQILSLGESPDGLFPKSFMAKTVTIIMPIIGVMGAIIAVLMATIRDKSAKERRARGLEIPALSKHIVLCGWNEHGIRVVQELTTDIPGIRQKHIVVVSESDQEKPLENEGLTAENVHFYRGMSSDPKVLEKINAVKADGFLVLAGEQQKNEKNFRSVFTVKMLANCLSKVPHQKRPRIMVDMVFKKNLEMFIASGADRILNTRSIGTVFLAFSSLNMGFSNVITSLMSLATRPVISIANSTDHKSVLNKVIGMNFSRAWHTLCASGFNLLAIYPDKGALSSTIGVYSDLPDPVIMGEEAHIITARDNLIIIENQALRKETVAVVSYADSNAGSSNELNDETPIVVIDRRNIAGEELKDLLSKRCPNLYYVCGQKADGQDDDSDFLRWDGKINSITDVVKGSVLNDLENKGYKGRIKFLIPTIGETAKYNSANAVHKDDETVALILQLNTLESDQFWYIAEIQCLDNLRLFKGVGVQQPIPVHEFASLALTKMTLFDGEVTGLIVRFMENFFTGKLEAKSLKKIAVTECGIAERIAGMNYVAAAKALFDAGIQLLAIIPSIRDEEEAHLISLPHKNDKDFQYQVKPEDDLFVIS
jgi:TRAP transporter TAXI family solute receptor